MANAADGQYEPQAYRRYANTGLGEWVPETGASPEHGAQYAPQRSTDRAPQHAARPAAPQHGRQERPVQSSPPANASRTARPRRADRRRAAESAQSMAPQPAAQAPQAVSTGQQAPPQPLDRSDIARPVKVSPQTGWRKMIHGVTGGRINPGQSRREAHDAHLDEKIQTPLRGDYRIAVMSLKGGVGKTTTTVALGSVLAELRGDRVIAIDANPDFGTLAQRVAAPGPATIRDLLAAPSTARYGQVRAFTTQGHSRLEVIGSERDPAVSEAFSEADYRHAVDILQHHYNLILTDCGTGLMHSAMAGVLDLANMIILVTSPALDGAQSAAATLDWLTLHGYERLAANAVVVVSSVSPKAAINMERVTAHFAARTRSVHVIAYDAHLAEGDIIDLRRMNPKTMHAYRQLAATIAGDFGSWHKHAR